ncbi:MAG: 3-dehydroquinate synthase [Holophagaceae bacterium]|nr:3-dehydroquinate synthase [Holophagaceae bacterium]
MYLEVPSGFATQIVIPESPSTEHLPQTPWLLLGDEAVRPVWHSFKLPEPPVCSWVKTSEASKRMEVMLPWFEQWSKSNINRNHTLVVVGGGLMTDMGGLAASLYMRGIKWHAWPTSLLGQIDASIGGKTAVNLDSGKNMVGTFHHPEHVVIISEFLESLPKRHLMAGKWELIKMALIEGDLNWAEALLDGVFPNIKDVERAIKLKINIVHQDFREEGNRRLLNLGHTFGHAFESASNHTILHGEAVGLGVLAACYYSERMNFGVFPPTLIEKMAKQLAPLSFHIPEWDKCLQFIMKDKKKKNEVDTYFIVPIPGSPPIQQTISPVVLESIHARLLKLVSLC